MSALEVITAHSLSLVIPNCVFLPLQVANCAINLYVIMLTLCCFAPLSHSVAVVWYTVSSTRVHGCTLIVSIDMLMTIYILFFVAPVVQPLILTINIRVAAIGRVSYTGQTCVCPTYVMICLVRVEGNDAIVVHLWRYLLNLVHEVEGNYARVGHSWRYEFSMYNDLIKTLLL